MTGVVEGRPLGTVCSNSLHDHPLPPSYIAAHDEAKVRLAAKWRNLKCPDCKPVRLEATGWVDDVSKSENRVRDRIVGVRVSPTEWGLLKAAAEAERMSVAGWVRECALMRAESALIVPLSDFGVGGGVSG